MLASWESYRASGAKKWPAIDKIYKIIIKAYSSCFVYMDFQLIMNS